MKKQICTRIMSLTMCVMLSILPVAGCANSIGHKQETMTGGKNMAKEAEFVTITIDEKVTHQTIESFGASGAWWSQDVGGWTNTDAKGVEAREQIATLLFDDENGIGLTTYRYNVGAGTADSGASYDGITDVWRRAECFEVKPGIYDWTKDKNAVWFMDRAVELGVKELVFFCNSPLERLTKNGKGFGDAATDGGMTSNLPEENYRAFAEYVMDVVEHFVNEGYPIKYVSPVNEPQWEWTGGQEGCHYEPEELVAFLNVFLDVMEERQMEGVELSAPELGEWGNTSYAYFEAIFADERLKNALTTLDVHSYWSSTSAKTQFVSWLEKNNLQQLELKTSEWCEMVNGKDYGMDSAIHLAMEINTDLTKLNVTSWQYWIAVSCYDYRDGLIYVTLNSKTVWDTKRLWAMGNFSRFIKEGYTRVDCTVNNRNIASSAYVGVNEDGEENLVVVLINSSENAYQILPEDFGDWTRGGVHLTDASHELENMGEVVSDNNIQIPAMSVVTVTLTK